tara:strand:+ start:426 stop:866 length:441 start_codon:yes stop_codon:yes gene_type:complete
MSSINDGLKLTGKLLIALNGKVIQEIDNLVTTAGKGYVANRMRSDVSGGVALMSHMAVGTGTTDPVVGNTALETESARVALTSSNVSAAVVTYIATFPAGTGTAALTEAGVLNASSGGTLLCRTEFSVVNKGSSDAMTITWTVTVS